MTIAPEKVKELKEPVSSIAFFNEIGDVGLIFSQEMYLEEIFADFEFSTPAIVMVDEDGEERRRFRNL